MNDTIDRYKKDMMLMHDKNRERARLQAYTEQTEEETPPDTPTPDITATLKVFVCEENGTPIPCACVIVTADQNLCYFVKTDEFGRAGVLTLNTGTYTVKVSAEGFDCATAEVTVTQGELKEQTFVLTRQDLLYHKAPLALEAVRQTIRRREVMALCTFPIQIGSCGECVKNLQERLLILSRVFDFITPPKVTGNYGQNTAAAVGKLQRAFSLGVDYCVNELTWECIYAASDAVISETDCDTQAKMCIEFPKNKVLKKGDDDAEVFFLQFLILKISQRFLNINKVTLSGVYDDATEKAVCTLQKIFSLPTTGRVGNATMSKILKLQADAN